MFDKKTTPPVEICPFGHGRVTPVDRGAYYEYQCLVKNCDFQVKNYKPKELKPGDKVNLAPDK